MPPLRMPVTVWAASAPPDPDPRRHAITLTRPGDRRTTAGVGTWSAVQRSKHARESTAGRRHGRSRTGPCMSALADHGRDSRTGHEARGAGHGRRSARPGSAPGGGRVHDTEHFTLQGARAATVAEFEWPRDDVLGAVSGGLVALGLMATASHVGTAFYAFGLILLPALAFIGMVTCERVVQSGTEDYGYARRIAAAARLLLRSGAGAHPLSAQRPS